MASTPPDWQVRPPRRKPRTLWSDLAGLWTGFRGLPLAAQFVIGGVAAVVIIGLASIVLRTGSGTEVSSRRPTTTLRSGVVPTVASTTTTVAIPPGDDVMLKGVLDGDSFEVADGTKIRLIGVDAPDVETNACFSAEATAHLRRLLEPARGLRLVYDATRTDRFGRTLAYVYRIPDGLLVNVALARDGFAVAQPSATNTLHAAAIEAAVEEARTARRGLWGACDSTTTTAARPSTTSAPATTAAPAPTTTEAPTTTAAPTTTTTTVVTVPGPVVIGSSCVPAGATSTLADNQPVVCAADAFGVLRWRRP